MNEVIGFGRLTTRKTCYEVIQDGRARGRDLRLEQSDPYSRRVIRWSVQPASPNNTITSV